MLPEALEAGDIFPDTTQVSTADRLEIGGCELVALAQRYGTPLYVYDEATVRSRARSLGDALAASYPGPRRVAYAAKAYCAPWLLRVVEDEGLGLDVVSGGELSAAVAADFPRERISLHGNNKSEDELEFALRERVGRIVVDNLDEMELLGRLASARGVPQPVLLRLGPAVDARTHAHLITGGADTKFGLDIASGQAAAGVRAALARRSLDLRGLQAHIGSQISEIEPYRASIERVLAFASAMREREGLALRELSPGGGYAVRYSPADPPVAASDMVRRVGRIAAEAAARHGFTDPLPALTIEPGRSIVAPAAVAVYRVGSVKAVPGGRTYVAVDGGMADNIRPTAYGAVYTAVLAERTTAEPDTEVAIAGRYCETGDILVQRIRLPRPRVGDLVVIPAAGAYQLSMASNYNMAPRPAVVVVADGHARLGRRRETHADLLAAEIL